MNVVDISVTTPLSSTVIESLSSGQHHSPLVRPSVRVSSASNFLEIGKPQKTQRWTRVTRGTYLRSKGQNYDFSFSFPIEVTGNENEKS